MPFGVGRLGVRTWTLRMPVAELRTSTKRRRGQRACERPPPAKRQSLGRYRTGCIGVGRARGKLHEIEAQLQEAVVRARNKPWSKSWAFAKATWCAEPIDSAVLRADDLWVRCMSETGWAIRVGQNVDVTIDSYQ